MRGRRTVRVAEELYDRNTWRGVDGPRLRDRRHPVVVLCVSIGALLALLYFAQTLNR